MKAYAVIGAGYGDEGKGLAVDWICSQIVQERKLPVVIRANGGTQAAHTVVTPEGERHVFNHIGSGSFLHAPTYLASTFILNPVGFKMEHDKLPQSAVASVYVDQYAVVSLPVDMLLNQMQEQRRGGDRHGSCGWGINETVERSSTSTWRVTYSDMCGEGFTAERVQAISKAYLEHRLKRLEIEYSDIAEEWRQRFEDPGIVNSFMADCEFMASSTAQLKPSDLTCIGDVLVFEGAQGLGLDEFSGHFPHVTRSRTGCTNMLLTALDAGVTNFEPIYVTRCYATRHGAGPLEHEGEDHGCTVYDPTNAPNDWQGTLRSAPLDMDLVTERIANDLAEILVIFPKARLNLLMTCLDQTGPQWNCKTVVPSPVESAGKPSFVQGRIIAAVQSSLLMAKINTHGHRILASYGTTRDHVQIDSVEARDTLTIMLKVVPPEHADKLRELLA